MKINEFRGDLTDNSAEKEALTETLAPSQTVIDRDAIQMS